MSVATEHVRSVSGCMHSGVAGCSDSASVAAAPAFAAFLDSAVAERVLLLQVDQCPNYR
jgi:hypothetical protein